MADFLPKPLQNVIDGFAKLPGIGQKTAQRLAFHLVRSGDGLNKDLGDSLIKLKEELAFCSTCFNITIDNPCSVCSLPTRDQETICVVEEPMDVIAIEKTGQYKGLYHVLHGVLSPIDGIGPQDLKIMELKNRCDGKTLEVILALNPSLEGEATAMYIQDLFKEMPSIKISRIARGLPMGGDLEYADPKTLIKALEGRSGF